jgi:hypothetical protein
MSFISKENLQWHDDDDDDDDEDEVSLFQTHQAMKLCCEM